MDGPNPCRTTLKPWLNPWFVGIYRGTESVRNGFRPSRAVLVGGPMEMMRLFLNMALFAFPSSKPSTAGCQPRSEDSVSHSEGSSQPTVRVSLENPWSFFRPKGPSRPASPGPDACAGTGRWPAGGRGEELAPDPFFARLLSAPLLKVNNFQGFNGKLIRWQKVKVPTSKQHAHQSQICKRKPTEDSRVPLFDYPKIDLNQKNPLWGVTNHPWA